ncbi:rCG30316, partial [Rattus norvegicus]
MRSLYTVENGGEAFRTKENGKRPQQSSRGEKPDTCGECRKVFRWPKGFSIHQRLHLTKRFCAHEHCGKGFCHWAFSRYVRELT